MNINLLKYKRLPILIKASWLFMILSWSFSINAQSIEVETQYTHFDNIGVKDGLYAGYIKNVLIDSDGYLWISTIHGLQIFDGYKINNFTHNPKDPFSIPNFYFREMLADTNGNIWLKTDKNRTFIFEKSTKHFIELDLEVSTLINLDDDNNLWFINNEKNLCYLPINYVPTDSPFIDTLWCKKNAKVIAIEESEFDPLKSKFTFHPNGELWVIHDFQLTTYTIDFKNGTLKEKHNLTFQNIGIQDSSLMPHLFIHEKTLEAYLFFGNEYCLLDKQISKVLDCHKFPKKYAMPHPQLIGPEGKLWLSCSGKLITLDLNTKKITELLRDKTTTILGNNINGRALIRDNYNNIWIPSNAYGIYKYASSKKRFQYFGDNHEGPTLGVLQALDYSIFFNYDGVLGMFDRQKNNFVALENQNTLGKCDNTTKQLLYSSQDSLLNTTIEIHCADLNQCFLYTIDREGNIIKPLKESVCQSDYKSTFRTLNDNPSWSYAEIWNETESEVNIQIRENNINTSSNSNTLPSYTQYDTTITGMHFRSPKLLTKKNLWFGFRDNGLMRFNIQSKTWTHYKLDQNLSYSLSSNVLYRLMEDPYYPDSLLWIATSNGINILDFINNKVDYLQKEDGLPSNVINAMMPDSKNNIWVSTNNGLAFIDYKSKNISSFYRSDGLQHEEFNTQSNAKTKDGYLYFGGMGGLTYFNPEDFYHDSIKSKVVIIDFKIFNKSIPYIPGNVNDDKFHINKPIDAPQTIVVDYDQKMLAFNFSVLDFTDPKKNEYRYKLDGFDKDWISLGQKNQATFTNLKPGLYTLNVQGKNYKGVWSDINNSTKLRVLSPWWMTWWFSFFFTVLILGIIYALYRYRIVQQEKIQALKNRISKDLHDEIGSTLSSIALYSLVAEKKIQSDQKEVKSILVKINESTTTMMESINDIVWTIGSGKELIKEIINRLRAFTSDLMLDDQQMIYEIQPKLLEKEVGMIVKRNIYLILKETINNAYKYSKASFIKVEMIDKNGIIVLSITDDGIGFNLENIQMKSTLGGNGLRNIESRVKEIGGDLKIITQENMGTKIEISFKL